MWGDGWTELVRPFHVRAQQLAILPAGQEVYFGNMDRNFCDVLSNMQDDGTVFPCPATRVFNRHNAIFGIYQAAGNNTIDGKFFIGCEGQEYPDWDNPMDLNGIEVECHPDHGLAPLDYCNLTMEELVDQNVRVGWRGPMIFESAVPILPDVFLEDELIPEPTTEQTAANKS